MRDRIAIRNENGIIRGTLTKPFGPPRGVLLCLHGGPGGDEHGNTNGFDQIAEMAKNIAFATLQFSFYGNGESDGSVDDYSISSQIQDFESAIEFIKERFYVPIHVIGESAGATIASLNWREDVASYVLLWPAFDLLDTDLRPLLTQTTLQALQEKNACEVEGVKLGRKLVYEILTSDFSKSFNLPDKPIFIAHGKADGEVPYEQSLRALRTAKSELLFFSHPSADHGFKDHDARSKLLSKLEKWLSDLSSPHGRRHLQNATE